MSNKAANPSPVAQRQREWKERQRQRLNKMQDMEAAAKSIHALVFTAFTEGSKAAAEVLGLDEGDTLNRLEERMRTGWLQLSYADPFQDSPKPAKQSKPAKQPKHRTAAKTASQPVPE